MLLTSNKFCCQLLQSNEEKTITEQVLKNIFFPTSYNILRLITIFLHYFFLSLFFLLLCCGKDLIRMKGRGITTL